MEQPETTGSQSSGRQFSVEWTHLPDSREYGRATVGQDVQQVEDARKQARDPNEQEEPVIEEPAAFQKSMNTAHATTAANVSTRLWKSR